MSIARIFTAKGWTAAQYDALIDHMQLGGRSAPGVLFHWAAETPDGMKVIDVYDSRDSADRLAQTKVGPAAQALGLPMPEISEYAVHAVLVP